MYFVTFNDSAPGGTQLTRVWFTNDPIDYHLRRILYKNTDLSDHYEFHEVHNWEEHMNKPFTIVAGNNSWIDYRSFNKFASRIVFTKTSEQEAEFLDKCFGYVERKS